MGSSVPPSESSPFSAASPDTQAPGPAAAGGWTDLAGAGGASGLLYVPRHAGRAVRLVVLFHGAGQSPRSVRSIFERHAREREFALLLPKSAGPTWDAISGRAGPDLLALGFLVAAAATRVRIDDERIAVAGFSDGASYALGVGIAFGERAAEVLAFSPGFVAGVGEPSGQPRIFISHGRGDRVLQIDRTSRRLVPALRGAGYDVEYREFDGGHAVPPAIASAAAEWLDPGPGDPAGKDSP
jgi:phospholipase/carboxylesterase